jgi:GntR family transcriptional regulator
VAELSHDLSSTQFTDVFSLRRVALLAEYSTKKAGLVELLPVTPVERAADAEPAPGVSAAALLADGRRLRADRARQVADVLRREVLSGAFAGGVLPPEDSLAREFGASRNAVREALATLRAEGLVTRIQGVGTLVAAEKYPHGLHRLLGLAETLREHGEVVNEVRTAGLVVPPPAIADRLALPSEAGSVVYIERLRRLNGVPLSLDLTYLARDVGEPLLDDDLAHTDIFAMIERHTGQDLGRAELSVEALSADPHSAALLAVPQGAALLMVERLTHLADGRPVDLEYIRIRGDRLVLRGELHRPLNRSS